MRDWSQSHENLAEHFVILLVGKVNQFSLSQELLELWGCKYYILLVLCCHCPLSFLLAQFIWVIVGFLILIWTFCIHFFGKFWDLWLKFFDHPLLKDVFRSLISLSFHDFRSQYGFAAAFRLFIEIITFWSWLWSWLLRRFLFPPDCILAKQIENTLLWVYIRLLIILNFGEIWTIGFDTCQITIRVLARLVKCSSIDIALFILYATSLVIRASIMINNICLRLWPQMVANTFLRMISLAKLLLHTVMTS